MSTTIVWVAPPADSSKLKLAVIELTYGIPSAILMLFLLIFMGCSKQYSYSFYRLVQVDLLSNMICWLNTWISWRYAEHPVGTEFLRFILQYIPFLFNISTLLQNFFFHFQFCTAVWMSVHRISSILLINSYEKFWSRYYLLIAIVFCVYGSLPQIIADWQPTQMNLVNGTLYFTRDAVHLPNFVLGINIFSYVYFVLLIGLGIAVPLVATKQFKGSLTNQRVSKKLTIIALIYGFVYSGSLCWTILRALQVKFKLFSEGFDSFARSSLGVASDMMSLALPYILLIFDSNIRRDLGLARKKIATSAFVSSTTGNVG